MKKLFIRNKEGELESFELLKIEDTSSLKGNYWYNNFDTKYSFKIRSNLEFLFWLKLNVSNVNFYTLNDDNTGVSWIGNTDGSLRCSKLRGSDKGKVIVKLKFKNLKSNTLNKDILRELQLVNILQ